MTIFAAIPFIAFLVLEVQGTTHFTVTTSESQPIDIDFAKYHPSPTKMAPKVLISQKPLYGSFPCSEHGQLDLEEAYCDIVTTYIPSPQFSGKDVFSYSYLHSNMTATADGQFEVHVVVRPKTGPTYAVDDRITMTTEDPYVHIPVLANDRFQDRADVCVQTYEGVASEEESAWFEDVAPQLGMTAMQGKPPKAPDCLFDQYDPNRKVWIKGAFCLPDESNGAIALADYDGDGLMDIYYARIDGTDQLWRNTGNGTYQLATTDAGLDVTMHHRSSGVAWSDVDNDGDLDLFIATMAEQRFYLYINDGMGHFTEEAELRGVALKPTIPPYQTSTMTIAVGDYDNDGWLDFYTTEWLPHLDQSFDYENATHSNSKLLRNLGAQGKPGYFEDVTEKAGLFRTKHPTVDADRMGGVDVRYYGVANTGLMKDILPGSFKLTAMFTDLDNDGHMDLLVNGDFRTSAIYWNNGNGTFREGTEEAGAGTDENGMGSTVADVDFDGKQDWFITSIHITPEQMKPFYAVYMGGGFIFGYTGNRFFKNEGNRKFKDLTDDYGVRIGQWGWGAAFFDFDNDGDLDIIHTNGFSDSDNTDADFLHGTRSKLFENKYFDDNKGVVRFEETGELRGVTDKLDGRGLFVFDYEEDGDLDVMIANNAERPILYRNIGGNKNDFLRVNVLEAEADRESIGAKVYLYSPRLEKEILREIRSVAAFSAQGETTAHFGLGAETAEAFTIRVHWPATNNTRIIEHVPRRVSITVRDILGQRNAIEVTPSFEMSVAKCKRTLVKAVTTTPCHGHVIAGPKHVTYYPNTGFTGQDEFQYSITDGKTTSTASVFVKVTKTKTLDTPSKEYLAQTFPRIDAVGNNPDHPDLGKPMMPLLRLSAHAYSDGYEEPAGSARPGPRSISNALFDQRVDVFSKEGLNEFHMNFGQLVAHDTDFATPYANFLTSENLGIAIPTGDPWFDPHGTGTQFMRFRRSAKLQTTGKLYGSPREQVNKITAFLDLSFLYGSQPERTQILRAMQDGKLKHQSGDVITANAKRVPNLNLLNGPREKMLVSGDNRVNVQPGLIALHTLWSREHNRICDELRAYPGNEDMDDETLFEHARSLTRAKWQKIVWDEYLPTVIGTEEYAKLGSYRGYNKSIHVGIFNEFSTAAFRFGHSQIGNTMQRLDENWEMIGNGHLPLRDAYFNPGRVIQEGGVEPLLRGMLKQLTQNVDTLFTDAVRNFLFGTNTMGLDLVSIGIQRGRDHGLPDYNTVREAVGLPRRTSFAEITPDEKLQKNLEVYPSIDDLDLWVGGLAEEHVEGGCVGETFARIMAKQFRVLRDGDRFWYENPDTMIYNLRDRTNLPTTGLTMNEVLYRNTGIKWKASTFHLKSGVQVEWKL